MIKSSIVYKYKNNLYLNITNRCPVKCLYCIKYRWRYLFRGYNLFIKKEPSYEEVITELQKCLNKYPDIKEVVFCGYGEPLLRWELVKRIAGWIKTNYNKIKVRVNTCGLANAYFGKNICRYLKKSVDSISVSLNAHDEKSYAKLHNTKIKNPYKKIVNFIKQAKKYIPEVIVTTINHADINIDEVKKIVKNNLQVKFRVRRYLVEYENK